MQRIVGRVKGCASSSCPLVRVPYSPSLSSLPCLSCSPSFGASVSAYTNSLECFCIRLHSTRTMTARPTTSRRRRPNTTYVELLEINKEKMTETKASVSKVKAKNLSNFMSNPKVSLNQMNQTMTMKVNENYKIDMDLLQMIENQILEKYSTSDDAVLKKDDCAIIFTSENTSHAYKLLQNEQRLKFIKDSYDKFRRETLQDQKMKDLISAIDEGVKRKFHFDIEAYQKVKKAAMNHDLQKLNLNPNKPSQVQVHGTKMLEPSMPKSKNIDTIPSLEELLEEENLDDLPQNLNEESELLSMIDDVLDNNNKKNDLNLKANKKTKKKKTIQNIKENDEIISKIKTSSMIQLLTAYLTICINVESIDKARKIITFYKNQVKKNHSEPIKDINLYNIVLTASARKGNYILLNEVLKEISEEKIKLNLQSYAIVFQCIERSNMNNKLSLLNKHWAQFDSTEFTLDDLFNKTIFLYDDREVLLKAIKTIKPDFSPQYTKPNLNYDCSLVNSLNSDGDKHGVYKTEDNAMPVKSIISIEKLRENILKQVQNEKLGTIEIENIEVNGNPSPSVIHYRNKLKEMENEWRDVIEKAFTRDVNTLKAQSNVSHGVLNIYPYLTVLDVKEFVDLLIFEIKKIADGSETYSPAVKALQRDLGTKVYSRFCVKTIEKNGVLDKLLHIYQKYTDWYINRDENDKFRINSRQKWQQLVSENMEGVSLDSCILPWPNTVHASIGKFLYNILINDVKIDVNIFQKNSKKKKYFPIFYNVFRGKGRLIRAEIKPHPVLPRLVRESKVPFLLMDTVLTPSLCPPLPWSSATHGGYLLTKTSLMRVPGNISEQLERLTEAPYQNLYPALDSLNQLGCVPWVINKPILDVLLNVFRGGGSRSLKVARPASSVPLPPPISATLPKRDRASAIRQRAIVTRVRQEFHSLWCDSLYKFSLANHFRDKVFWLPHNMDFRGRVYPFPPHLSHLGSDTSRALLVFAQGKPLGPNGFNWLKLHCVNLTGTMKKKTIKERLEYAESVMDDIIDSADNPLNGRKWWAQSEDPWQTLACCMEIANASRSPNCEEYVCHFPVHQDGSCNGLQHYAALGGDSAGAFSVNLDCADRPQDVYSAVVNLVEAARIRDAKEGVKVAGLLEGFVKRKVIKQTVMTTVYGVTKYGARLQIAKQLKDIDDFPKEEIWAASHYLTQKTFESIGEMFTSTKEIQDWLTECAKLISGVCNAKIEWVTPLGLPVLQPYFKYTTAKPVTKTDNNLVLCALSDKHEKPCILKQKNAFPPNFIHSLDSSHMMLTSLFCEASNVIFVSVHDCFWTHPSSVETMNRICRDQFVSLHSHPIMQNLSKDLTSKFAFRTEDFKNDGSVQEMCKKKLNVLLKKVPEKGDFDLNKVLNSVYFFS